MVHRIRRTSLLILLLSSVTCVRGCDNFGCTWEFSLGLLASFVEFRTFAFYGLVTFPIDFELLAFSFPALLLNMAGALVVCSLLFTTGLLDRLAPLLVATVLVFTAALIFPFIQGLPLLVIAPFEMRAAREDGGQSLLLVSRGLLLVTLLVVALMRLLVRPGRPAPDSTRTSSTPPSLGASGPNDDIL